MQSSIMRSNWSTFRDMYASFAVGAFYVLILQLVKIQLFDLTPFNALRLNQRLTAPGALGPARTDEQQQNAQQEEGEAMEVDEQCQLEFTYAEGAPIELLND